MITFDYGGFIMLLILTVVFTLMIEHGIELYKNNDLFD